MISSHWIRSLLFLFSRKSSCCKYQPPRRGSGRTFGHNGTDMPPHFSIDGSLVGGSSTHCHVILPEIQLAGIARVRDSVRGRVFNVLRDVPLRRGPTYGARELPFLRPGIGSIHSRQAPLFRSRGALS